MLFELEVFDPRLLEDGDRFADAFHPALVIFIQGVGDNLCDPRLRDRDCTLNAGTERGIERASDR